MKREITGRAGTSSSGREAITEKSTERIPHLEMTARGGDPGITEARAVEANSVLPKKECAETITGMWFLSSF